MYHVNRDQIEKRLDILMSLSTTAARVARDWNPEDPVLQAALERVAHLALEAVTDVGSLLIDGFLMRDAGSYEDIITILKDEQALTGGQADYFLRLVRQRKPLVREYWAVEHEELLALAVRFPQELAAFASGIQAFIDKESV